MKKFPFLKEVNVLLGIKILIVQNNMYKKKERTFRTNKNDIRIADYTISHGEAIFRVKRKGIHDTFTLSELLREVYGQDVRCIVYGRDDIVLTKL